MMSQIFVATKSAMFVYKGERVNVKQGKTTVREGHPILAAHADLFKPLVVNYECDDAPSPPPAPVAAAPPPRVEEATDDPDRPRRRGRPPMPRDSQGRVIHSKSKPEKEE